MTNQTNGKWRQVSHRHCIFIVLSVGVVLFLQYSSIKEMAPAWNPKQWMQNHSTKLFILFRKQYIGLGNANRSEVEAISTGNVTTPYSTAAIISAELPQVERISSTQKPKTKRQTTVSPEVIQQVLQPQTARPTPGTYISPGPYLVEYPYEYHFTINEPQKCEQGKPFVVLMVPVAPHNIAHREVVRSTWGTESLVLDKVVMLFFLLGMQTGDDSNQVHEQLLHESKEHKDLIQSDFVDCYKNLTIKTMVMLEWLNLYCSNASYAMKIDSDMFLHVPNLVQLLINAPKTNYMTGLVAHGGQVLRNPSSKWFLPHELFSPSVYPPYALGLGYILSLDLTNKLIEASRHVKAVYIEDVYLGLCMQHLGLVPTDPPGGSLFHVFPLKYDQCVFSKIIATTVEPFNDRVKMWTHFKAEGPYC
ncbi:beta-1,3-galactosyltransferase 1 [Nothobranchius furzeri]|uniref:Hexosyltransferase n=1 Tax=Nothobranchius furzeri TaxID=105023 RepID=A0A9D2Y217_NOTFU|nr:beta-1,3-galactosyltransferase 1 [Nothobranchius furzeri]KAF7212592.1 3-galactosyltransferase 1-like [Nothobranchius furzeri]